MQKKPTKFLKNLQEITGAKKVGFGSPARPRYKDFKLFFFSFRDEEDRVSIKFACSLDPMPILIKTAFVRKEKIDLVKASTLSLFKKVFGQNVFLCYTDNYVTVSRWQEGGIKIKVIKYKDTSNLKTQLKNMAKMKREGFEVIFHDPKQDKTSVKKIQSKKRFTKENVRKKN